jgi:pimeloyl-ACP methyl ester carboxylesterase
LHLGDGAVKRFLGTDPVDRPDVDPMHMPGPDVAVSIVQGSVDEIVPPSVPQSYCAAFPATRIVQLQGSGHFALIDPLSSAWPVVLNELGRM